MKIHYGEDEYRQEIQPVYVYDTLEDDHSLFSKLDTIITGTRYVACVGRPRPWGKCNKYWYTERGAARRALKEFKEKPTNPQDQMIAIYHGTEMEMGIYRNHKES